ncbi:MAG: OmpA family protein [Gammaproteobacteria bacterium]|nr:OmpA family protein [Gammaproteobacteria bacterium]NNL45488.1 OmpA family protein [Woeseiaceae bacterium]
MFVGMLACFAVGSGYTSHEPGAAQYSALEPPRFEFSIRRGTLHLAGHTASSAHEQQLLQTARRVFPDAEKVTDFRPLGLVPAKWTAATVSVLEALSATQSSSALLTNHALHIRGIATEEWPEQVEVLRASLQGPVDLEADMVIPDATIRVAKLCKRAFAAHRPGTISFEESGTTFRSAAYAALDRTISLANACRDSSISITGHTDSSGHESWNRRLSLARAKAVADYLAERGVSRERLIVIGAGSSEPVADNATHYGRSMNRRISIVLHDRNDAEQT